MDSARDRLTNGVVDAESLWELSEVQRDRYECHGCGAPVIPKSYEKGVNKKRPYFSVLPSQDHIDPCAVDGEKDFVARAQRTSIGLPDGFPLPFPNKLVITDERPVVDAQAEAPAGESRSAGRSHPRDKNDAYHGHTVKTLRPICRTYMKYPHDRARLPLSVPGCEGNTFDSVFWRLGKV